MNRITTPAIDFAAKTITCSKKFLKKAREVNSDEYRLMLQITSDLPAFMIVIKEAVTPVRRNIQPTYTAMAEYMEDVRIVTIEQNGLEVIVPREGREEFEKKDMSAYTNYTFSMYGGEIVPVTMVFQNRMLNTVIDRFGKDVLAYPVDKNHFRITVPVAVSDQFFGWVFGLGNYVTIEGPDDVKEKMRAALAKVAKRYEK